jgi:hypothetical protein
MKTVSKKYCCAFFLLMGVVLYGQQSNVHTIYAEKLGMIQPSVESYQDKFIVVGTVSDDFSTPTSKTSIMVMMLDESNNIVWSKVISSDGLQQFAGSVTVDPQLGLIVLTGYVWQGQGSTKDLLVMKLDMNGNIVDHMVYEDSVVGYSLYGLDIININGKNPCDPDNGMYMIAGVGSDGATQAAQKYAFVMGIRKDGSINWVRKYESTGTSNQYNSFNHILKVEGHPKGEAYLLTGSGVDPMNGEIMATNDLIDRQGKTLWNPVTNAAVGTKCTRSDGNPGVKALYNKYKNEFYLATHGGENMISIVVMDGNGVFIENHFLYLELDHYLDHNKFVTGMKWISPFENKLLITIYNTTNNSSVPQGYQYGFIADMDKDANNQIHTEWYVFPKVYNALAYNNINFDYIVKPVNYVSGNGDFEQIFYQPKSLTKGRYNYEFLGPFGDPPFGFNSYSMGINLFSDCNTYTPVTGQNEQFYTQYSNFVSTAYQFESYKYHFVTRDLNLLERDYCEEQKSAKKTSSLMNGDKDDFVPKQFIKLSPNPTNDIINISGLSSIENASLSLYNIEGKQVHHSFLKQDTNASQINVAPLQPGIYFMEIKNKGSVIYHQKIIKK